MYDIISWPSTVRNILNQLRRPDQLSSVARPRPFVYSFHSYFPSFFIVAMDIRIFIFIFYSMLQICFNFPFPILHFILVDLDLKSFFPYFLYFPPFYSSSNPHPTFSSFIHSSSLLIRISLLLNVYSIYCSNMVLSFTSSLSVVNISVFGVWSELFFCPNPPPSNFIIDYIYISFNL